MKEVDCNKCKNKNTKWCSGCEYNYPSVDNFDFYSEIKDETRKDNNNEL